VQPEDVLRAAGSSASAFDAWRALRPTERGRILVEIGRVARLHAQQLGEIESLETGKPGREMPVLIDLVAQFFEYYGGLANAMDGEVINVGSGYHSYALREPYGVVGVILPWNAPLHQAARAIAPALAAGNTVLGEAIGIHLGFARRAGAAGGREGRPAAGRPQRAGWRRRGDRACHGRERVRAQDLVHPAACAQARNWASSRPSTSCR